MAGNSPVALPLLLTVVSLVASGYSWHNTSHELPLWWSVHGHPLLWVPRWVGLLLFPVLGLLIPYIIYQVVSRDSLLDGQSGESAYAVANLIALPSLLLFAEYVLVYLPCAISSAHDFPSRIFTSNLAIWGLAWLGYNLQYVEPNSSIGVPVFCKDADGQLWTTIHQRAGWGLMAGGLVLFIFALACPIGVAYFVVSLVLWLGCYVGALLHSYALCRRNYSMQPSTAAADDVPSDPQAELQQPLVSDDQA